MKTAVRILGIVLLVTGLIVWNAFFGNPVSKWLAENASDAYIAEHYGNLDLEKGRIFYNLKDGCYTLSLQDRNSIDTKFRVGFDSFGGFCFDTFESRGFNTLMRFEDALKARGKEIEQKLRTDYEIRLSIGVEVDFRNELTPDQPVDLNAFPFPVEAQAFAFREEMTYEEVYRILKELRSIMDHEPFDVAFYSIILIPEKDRAADNEAQTWKNALSIHRIPDRVIRDGSADDLKQLHMQQESAGKAE